MRNFKVTVNGTSYDVTIEEVGASAANTAAAPKAAAPAAAPAAASAPKAAPAVAGEGTPVKAPFPGNILRVNAKVGDTVKKGDAVCVIEAMKMENEISAPADGVITSIAVAQGKTVATDDLLFTIK